MSNRDHIESLCPELEPWQVDQIAGYLDSADAQIEELRKGSAINTNVRLFDLVRYMRSELHEAELITDEEYAWLLSEAPMARGKGSPSPRRLEDYDEIRTELKSWQDELSKVMPKDFKDWWQNSKKEWPVVARLVIENSRKNEELAWETLNNQRLE